jgi:hypothetical protein
VKHQPFQFWIQWIQQRSLMKLCIVLQSTFCPSKRSQKPCQVFSSPFSSHLLPKNITRWVIILFILVVVVIVVLEELLLSFFAESLNNKRGVKKQRRSTPLLGCSVSPPPLLSSSKKKQLKERSRSRMSNSRTIRTNYLEVNAVVTTGGGVVVVVVVACCC